MTDLDTLRRLINPRLARVLRYAEAALPAGQFSAFRKLVLDEFGQSGLEGELQRAFGDGEHGQARHGQANTAKKGGCP